MSEPAKVLRIIPNEWRVERAPLSGEMLVKVDDFVFVTIGYDYRYTSNSHQWRLAEQIARSLMNKGDSLFVNGTLAPAESSAI